LLAVFTAENKDPTKGPGSLTARFSAGCQIPNAKRGPLLSCWKL
jgi:hypothetical protein